MAENLNQAALWDAIPLSLRYLRAFYQVSRCGSVSKASQALRRAQSAVSRAVLQLEAELAVPLFERSVRGMLPTEFGAALLNRVERANAHMEAAYREIASSTGVMRHAPLYDLYVVERQLSVLLELGRQRHMSTVAGLLAISQPAVSLAVRNIEESLGITLFERTVRGVRPTPLGETLIHYLRLALNEVRIAVDEIAAIRGVKQGEVRVGALSLARTYLLPTAVTRLLCKYPGIRVSTMEGPFDTLATSLRSGEIDLLLGALRPLRYTEGLEREPLLKDEMAMVVRAGHPLTVLDQIGFECLEEAEWVLPHRHTSTRALLESAAARRGLSPPRVLVESTDLSVIREVLLASELITAISAHQFSREISSGILVRLPLRLSETSREIGMLRRKYDRPSPAAALLIAEMKAIECIPSEPATYRA